MFWSWVYRDSQQQSGRLFLCHLHRPQNRVDKNLIRSGLKKQEGYIKLMKEEESKNGNGSTEGMKEPEPHILREMFSPVDSLPQPPPKISGRDSKKEKEGKEEGKAECQKDNKEEEEAVKAVEVSQVVKELKPEKKLTEKEKAFCQEYLKDFNGCQSAIRAGYSENSARNIASENLTKPYIAQYLQQLIDKRSENCELSAQWVLDNLKEVVARCMQAEPVFDNDGNLIEYKFNAMGANKSLELIGKHLGMFKDVTEVKNEQGFQLVILGDQPKKDDEPK